MKRTSTSELPQVIALLPDRITRERLGSAVALFRLPHPVVQFVEDWAALHSALQSSPCTLVVLDPFDGSDGTLSRLEVLRSAFQLITLLAYCRLHPYNYHAMRGLARLGVHEIVVTNVTDDSRGLQRTLEVALQESRFGAGLVEVMELMPPRLHKFVSLIVQAPGEHWSPARAAAVCGCHPRTLREYLRSVGLPSTHRLITWFRLLAAVELLAAPARSVDQVADALRFPSSEAMRAQMRRYLGRTPSHLRERSAFASVLRTFREECFANAGARTTRQTKISSPAEANGASEGLSRIPVA